MNAGIFHGYATSSISKVRAVVLLADVSRFSPLIDGGPLVLNYLLCDWGYRCVASLPQILNKYVNHAVF